MCVGAGRWVGARLYIPEEGRKRNEQIELLLFGHAI